MPLDPTIPLGVTQPDVAGTIGKWQQLGIQTSQAETARNQAALSSATLQPSIRSANAAANTAEIGTKREQATLSREQIQPLFTSMGALATHPAIVNFTKLAADPASQAQIEDASSPVGKALDGVYRAISNARRAAVLAGTPDDVAEVAAMHLAAQARSNPASLVPELIQSLKIAQGPSASAQQMFPAPQVLNTGQVAQPIASGNPALTGVQAGTTQGASTQMQLPPTQPVFQDGKPGVLGANPAPGIVQTGPALGQEVAVHGRVVPNVKHFADVQAAAIAAPMRITQLQEIKALAPGAVTGDANFKRQVFSKLAGYFGFAMDPTSQTMTDEMAKSGALLLSQAGQTDAAREVAAMATPNYKMTKEAINNVSNALVGLEKRNLAASKYFTGIPQDSQEYESRFQTWNNIPARDEVFKLDAMPLDERQAAMNKLRGTSRGDAVLRGARQLRELRLLQ
jgi:hypothetical protein